MQASPLSPLRVLIICLAAALCLSCGKDKTPPKGPDWLDEKEDKVEVRKPKPFVSPLDSYGNLKGRGERIMGFERPFASREADHRSKVPVYYLMANEERMLRFYRSRGHVVIETGTGWRFEHSDRTLQAIADPEEARSFKKAKIYASQGPGAGWTLIFDDGKPIETAPLPLMELLSQVEQGQATSPSVSAPGKGEAKAPPSRPHAKQGSTGSQGTRLQGRALRKLERSALQRDINTKRAKDVSARIYKHAKKRGQRFLD